jgi:hypothetical protein
MLLYFDTFLASFVSGVGFVAGMLAIVVVFGCLAGEKTVAISIKDEKKKEASINN